MVRVNPSSLSYMPRVVSPDLKAWVPVLRFELGLSVKDICKVLGIRKTLVYQTLHYHFIYGTTTNSHARSKFGPRKLSQIDLTFIRDMIAQRHCVYLDEIQEELVARRDTLVSIPTLAWTLRRLEFSHKKVSARAIERNKIMRAAFMNKIGTEVLDPAMLMFTDETAKDERTSGQRMGWSKIGTRCVQRRCFVRGQRYSILPVLTLDGLITWDVIEGSVTSERFVEFLRENVVRVYTHIIWRSLISVQTCIDTPYKSISWTLECAYPWQLQHSPCWWGSSACRGGGSYVLLPALGPVISTDNHHRVQTHISSSLLPRLQPDWAGLFLYQGLVTS